jgi:probable rRNA maturation factor
LPQTFDIDIQRHSPLWRGLPRAAAVARKAAIAALRQGGLSIKPGAAVAIALADDRMVKAANRQWRAKDRPTNVLSFPAVSADRAGAAPFLGDVILAYETIAAEAEAEGRPPAHHLSHLVVHGVLHLLGYDHMTKAEAELMERRETLILASIGVPDPYSGSEPMETLRT